MKIHYAPSSVCYSASEYGAWGRMVYLAGNISEGWEWSSGIMPTATLHGIAGFVVITEDCISMAEFIAALRDRDGGRGASPKD